MSQALARTLVFVTSAAVLVIEILAARILAPYLGVSLEVFTGIIGVILAGISLGAWLGGRAADNGGPTRLLGPLLVAGGLTAMASPLIIDLIGPTLGTGPLSIVIGATAGFFAPAAILSAVPPVIVKIQLASLEDTGRVVGTYSAIGTAGAILGTFATGFFLIAAFPTRPIVITVGALQTLLGSILWVGRRQWALASIGAAGLLALGLLAFDGPCQYETTYSCAIVEVDENRDTGRVLLLDRVRNSYVDVDDPTYLEFRYINLMADVISVEAPDGPIDMVSIGGGGFTMPGYIEATRPGSENTVLEIDAKLVDIGRTDLSLSEAVNVVVDDARISMRRVETDSADIVIGDAFSGASVPWHLTTVEFNSEIDRVLSADGVYVMNIIDYGDRRFVRSGALTLRETFANVAVLAPPSYIDGDRGGNYVLIASQEPIDIAGIEAAIDARGSTEIGIDGDRLTAFIADGMILTDDFAPVDQMLDPL